MARRYITVAVVFLVCFGLGYGATWLVVGSPDSPPAPVMAGEPTREATAKPTTVEPEPTSVAPTEPTGEADVAVAADPDAAPAEAETAVAEAETAVAEADTQVASAEEVAAPVAEPWWDACRSKVCIIDWGRVSGGISVRDGRIEHGTDVDWANDFAKADKVGTLEAKKNMKVEVLAVGMAEGKPAAAWIKYKNLTGVIALAFGDKTISFVPLSE